MGWSFDPLQIGAIAAVGGLYALRARQLRARGARVRWYKPPLFALALVTLVLAIASPLDALGEERLFSAHMAQHILIGDLAPLLVVLGLSGPLLRPLLALPHAMRAQALTHPAIAVPVWAVDLYAWHVPRLYDAALRHPVVHAAEHLCFFVGGALLWAALLEPIRAPWREHGSRLAGLVAAWVAAGVLANIFLWSSRPYYSPYVHAPRAWGLSPVADQRLGGGIMLMEMSLVMVAVGVCLALQWLREMERRQRLVDDGIQPDVAARLARRTRR